MTNAAKPQSPVAAAKPPGAPRHSRSPVRPAPSASRTGGPSVVDVVRKVDEAVARGRLAPGQRLVEADLMADYGASRSVVREALRFLAGEGLVEITPNRGARVKRIDLDRMVHMFAVYSAILRASLETLVAKPISREVQAQIKSALRRIVEAGASRDGLDRAQVDAAFNYHYVICENCGNPYFSEALERLHMRHYVRHAELEHLADTGVDVGCVYTEATREILRRNHAAARAILNPFMAMLGDHLRQRAKQRG
jgi:DNA-binding GntR family transcriptional regulator